MGINTDSDRSRAADPGMLLSQSLGLDVTIAKSGSIGHPDLYGPGGSMALKHQHELVPVQTLDISKALSGKSCH